MQKLQKAKEIEEKFQEEKKKQWQKKREEQYGDDTKSEAVTNSHLEEFMEDEVSIVQIGQLRKQKSGANDDVQS